MKPRLYLSPPHMSGNELKAIGEVFASNWIAPVGPDIVGFENEMCGYTGAEHAVALSSGTAAIHLALQICGVQFGDEVLCSTFTFAGSVFPVRYCGAEPVFVDSDKDSWNMDPGLLETAIIDRLSKGKRPSAVITVHLYGQSARIDEICRICDKYGIPLIEDAAESVGAFFGGQHTGTFGRFGVFSFNGNKIITTSGGGMLVGKNKSDIDRARFLSTQARENFPYYEHLEVGYNYRLSNVLAAIGRGQLKVLEERVQRRTAIFNRYRDLLAGVDAIKMGPIAPWGRPNFWLTCVLINTKRDLTLPEKLRLTLEAENVESRPLWKPMHLQPLFKQCVVFSSGVAEGAFQRGLCLPSGSSMSDADMDRVVATIRSFFSRQDNK